MLYAHPKFKVNAALVPGPWVMGISAGWFRARGLDGWQSETTCGLRAFGQTETTCGLRIAFETPVKKKKKKKIN